MPTNYVDSSLEDADRRHLLYGGDLFTYSAGPSARGLVELARELSAQRSPRTNRRSHTRPSPLRNT